MDSLLEATSHLSGLLFYAFSHLKTSTGLFVEALGFIAIAATLLGAGNRSSTRYSWVCATLWFAHFLGRGNLFASTLVWFDAIYQSFFRQKENKDKRDANSLLFMILCLLYVGLFFIFSKHLGNLLFLLSACFSMYGVFFLQGRRKIILQAFGVNAPYAIFCLTVAESMAGFVGGVLSFLLSLLSLFAHQDESHAEQKEPSLKMIDARTIEGSFTQQSDPSNTTSTAESSEALLERKKSSEKQLEHEAPSFPVQTEDVLMKQNDAPEYYIETPEQERRRIARETRDAGDQNADPT
jgi:signal transduction histidine kinase